jgi:sugar phosphate isomerase/epimerase
MAKLSAFADEVSADFCEQVQFLSKEGLHYIEPRFINKKNIMDLTKGQLKESKKIIQDAGLAVSAIGSPIGKVRLDEPFPPHLDKFKHAIELAQLFETPYIRVFSYYAPKERNINDFRKHSSGIGDRGSGIGESDPRPLVPDPCIDNQFTEASISI